ncbi:hypothetical protein ACE1AT_25220 [Pelatocladus sp. BLCC-F211]|uniref:hypothetical protein n=1 Tax=Pelatocladus sp. BLCC-F211 TaxID=3342752 RepID=UPI0035B83DBF
MKVTKNQPFETTYSGYKIEITKPTSTYAYYVRGEDLDDSEGGFTSTNDALTAAKSLIDEDDFWLSPDRFKEQAKAKKLFGKKHV